MGYIFKVIGFVFGIARDIPYARWIMLGVGVTGLLSGLANTGLIMLINTSLTSTGVSKTTLAWGFLGLCLGLPVFRFISQVMLVRLSQKTLLQLRLRWCRRILSLPLRQLEEIGPSRLMASLTNDIGSISDALVLLPLILMHSSIVVTCLAYLGWLSLPLLLGLLGFMVIGILTYQLPLLKALFYQRKAREEWDSLFEHVRGVTQGFKELKMHQPRRQALIERRLEPTTEALRRHINAATTIFAAASSWGQVLFFVAIGLLIFVVPKYQELTPAVILGYSITLIHMMTPLEVILNSFSRMTNSSVAIDKIKKLGLSLSLHANEPDAERVPASEPTWRRLELSGVTHLYQGENEQESFLLGPIDLTIEAGELVFIVGGNGSGKTTLAKIILGLYAPDSGEILLDSEPVTDENRDAYRQNFSAVFSDYFLFGTFLGMEDPHLDGRARQYLKEFHLERKVRIEDGTLSTTDLSQGQRKRLALLTAYLEDRPIYLFDEWAADQDPFFKEIFYRELLPELKARGKTVLVISHDDRYYDAADRIVKLESGQLSSDERRENVVVDVTPEVVDS